MPDDLLAATLSPERCAARATAVESLTAEYERWANEALAAMRAALAAARAQSEPQAQALQRIFDIAHDIKGQGASFGYPLMTRIAQSLCRIGHSAPLEALSPEKLKAMGTHLDALAVILDKRIRGDGGAGGARLISKLESISA